MIGVEHAASSQAVVAAPVPAAAAAKRDPMSRQQAVAMSQERRNAGRKPRHGADTIDPMDPVRFFLHPHQYQIFLLHDW